MNGFLRPTIAVLWKDIVLEARTKDIVVAVLVFSLLVILVFNFAIEPAPHMVVLVAPGILWVAFVFGGVLGLTRSFALEKENGSLHGLMLAPVSRDTIFFGKMLAVFLLMLLVEAIVLPIFAVLFNLSLAAPRAGPCGCSGDPGDRDRRHGLLGDGDQHPGPRGDAAHALSPRGASDHHRGSGGLRCGLSRRWVRRPGSLASFLGRVRRHFPCCVSHRLPPCRRRVERRPSGASLRGRYSPRVEVG